MYISQPHVSTQLYNFHANNNIFKFMYESTIGSVILL